jgi:ElaB/YqjD/DUF883 family membrane-anchored ribosome-binding protein
MINPMTTIDSKKQDLADSLESAADAVRSAADDSVHAINDLANQAGKKLDCSASRLRSWTGPKAFGGLRKNINRKPLQSVAIAAAVGLVTGACWKAMR